MFDGHTGRVEIEWRYMSNELEEERRAAAGGVRLEDEFIS